MGDSALFFRIDPSVDNAWGITYLYGCTALMISDPEFVIGTHLSFKQAQSENLFVYYTFTDGCIVAHMQQETATGKICINDQIALNNWLSNTLLPALDQVRSYERPSSRLRGPMLTIV